MDLVDFVDQEMKLTTTPGIYLNIPNAGYAGEGKGLSGRQLEKVLDSTTNYFEDYPACNAANSRIDTFFTSEDVVETRRYIPSDRSRDVARQWISRVREMYLKRLPAADLDEPFTRCLAECGWGSDIRLGATAHPTNIDTTYLFAPYNVLTRMAGFPEPLQLALFLIWTKDVELCRIAEIVGHILCSTFWFEGGLNSYWAGGSSPVGACMLLLHCTCFSPSVSSLASANPSITPPILLLLHECHDIS